MQILGVSHDKGCSILGSTSGLPYPGKLAYEERYTAAMENQMDKNMEKDTEGRVIWGYIGDPEY